MAKRKFNKYQFRLGFLLGYATANLRAMEDLGKAEDAWNKYWAIYHPAKKARGKK